MFGHSYLFLGLAHDPQRLVYILVKLHIDTAVVSKHRWRSTPVLPRGEILVTERFLIIYSRSTLGPEELAQLCTSGCSFTKVEVNHVGHNHRFSLYSLAKVLQVPDRDRLETLALARAIVHQPGNDSFRILFVSDVGIQKTWGEAIPTCWMDSVDQHSPVSEKVMGMT